MAAAAAGVATSAGPKLIEAAPKRAARCLNILNVSPPFDRPKAGPGRSFPYRNIDSKKSPSPRGWSVRQRSLWVLAGLAILAGAVIWVTVLRSDAPATGESSSRAAGPSTGSAGVSGPPSTGAGEMVAPSSPISYVAIPSLSMSAVTKAWTKRWPGTPRDTGQQWEMRTEYPGNSPATLGLAAYRKSPAPDDQVIGVSCLFADATKLVSDPRKATLLLLDDCLATALSDTDTARVRAWLNQAKFGTQRISLELAQATVVVRCGKSGVHMALNGGPLKPWM